MGQMEGRVNAPFIIPSRPGTHRLPCPECGQGKRRDTALAVTVSLDGAAVWYCHRCGFTGGNRSRPTDRQRIHQKLADFQAPHRPTEKNMDVGERIQRTLTECRPTTPDGAVGRYLARRRCPMPDHDVVEHPGLWHAPSGKRWPAMVAIVTDACTVEPITYVAPDGSGKAPVDRPRLLMKGGRKSGGVVRLFEDAEVTTGLGIAEGIETALSAVAAGFTPVWSTNDAGNMAAFPVLPGIECLTVFVDHDGAGKAAFDQVARRWLAAGREVRRVLPPDPKTDFNDLVVGAA